MLDFPWNYRDSVYSFSLVLLCVFAAIAWGYGPTVFSSVQLICVVSSVDEVI